MTVYTTNPLTDTRWRELLLIHRHASVFHSHGWLSALQKSYGYTPMVFTTSPPDESLANGVVFCEVNSWLTGHRLVSLPFSDHCESLTNSPTEHAHILKHVREYIVRSSRKYAEIRPLSMCDPKELTAVDLTPSENFFLHLLSLDPSPEELFRGLHKDCIQRKVRRAEKEGLRYEMGRSEPMLWKFYQLQVRTRRRQGLPPQPVQWFRHLVSSMGDHLTIRVASKDGHPVAAILTLSFKDTVTYKYGCSDERFNQLGGTPFLFWKTIQEAKAEGMRQLDLGRSERDNPGLIAFKDRLGATRIPLTYWRYPQPTTRTSSHASMRKKASSAIRRLPSPVLSLLGRLLYRHVG